MLHVAQISFFSDPARRAASDLLSAWITVPDMAEAVAQAGVRVSVIQAHACWETIERNGVRYYFLPFGNRDATSVGVADFTRLLNQLQPDVCHVQGLGFSRQVLRLAAAAPSVPILLQDRANRPPRFWRRWVWRRAMAAARGVVFCAREQAEPFISERLLPSQIRIYEIPGSTCRFAPGDQAAARSITGLYGAPCLLWVGHLNENKDPLTVLEGVAQAAERLPDVQLWCCFGLAPLLKAVLDRIETDPRLKGRVHLLGSVPHEDIQTLMRAADFLVQGSHRESTGYSVMEALACGLPPVVTDIPSFRSLTAGGTVGRLWACREAGQLAQALLQLAEQPSAVLRAAARAQFDKELSFAALGRRLRTAYSDLSSHV